MALQKKLMLMMLSLSLYFKMAVLLQPSVAAPPPLRLRGGLDIWTLPMDKIPPVACSISVIHGSGMVREDPPSY
jgi:hypothetical protein